MRNKNLKRNRTDIVHIEKDIYYCSKEDKYLKYNPDNDLYQWFSYPSSKTKPLIGVYYIYDKLHNKYYIGSSINIIDRVSQHKTKFKSNHTSSLMYQSALCHGSNFIKFGILELCDKEDLSELERYYITLADSVNNGWNVSNKTHDCWLRTRVWQTNNFYKQKSPN